MILVADSGSTKTDWVLISGADSISFQTIGLSPYFVEHSDISSILLSAFPNTIHPNSILQIFFYGTGCGTEASQNIIQTALSHIFTKALIHVTTDLVGAAIALLRKSEGIIAILGTGMNIGYWNGTHIEYTQPSLGYILGDEGSGAYLGKQVLNAYFYEEMPEELMKKFWQKYKLTREMCVENVYKQPFPNKYLATFSEFLYENKHHTYIKTLIKSAFYTFVEKHVIKIAKKSQNFRIFVIGSIGYYFADFLQEACIEKNITVIRVEKSPIFELKHYHSQT